MRLLHNFALTLLAVCLVQPAYAQDIRIDLSNRVSTTPGNWNNISNLNGLTSNLIDFPTGSATGVSITGNGSWLDFFGDNSGTFPNQAWLIQPATQDGAGLPNGTTGSFLISGLTDSTYTIEVVSARTTFSYLNTITVNGVLANRTELGTTVITPWNSSADGLIPGNWLIWDNVIPVIGEINIVDTSDASTLGILNAFHIVSAVPEPTTWALIGVGALGTGMYAWRKKRLANKAGMAKLKV